MQCLWNQKSGNNKEIVKTILTLNFCLNFSLKLIKDHCMSFIVKEDNFNSIVMSNDFENLDKPLMVEIVRKRVYPGRMNDIRISKLMGKR